MPPKRNGAPYRRIIISFWNDPDVKNVLTRDEKLFANYLFTNEHSHPCGVYGLRPIYVMDELGFSKEEMRAMLAGPLSRFVTYDWRTEEVFVHAMAEHQIDGNGLHGQDNRIAWVKTQLQMVHSADLVRAFRTRYPSWNLPWPEIMDDDFSTPGGPPKGASQGASESERHGGREWHNHAEKEGALVGASKGASQGAWEARASLRPSMQSQEDIPPATPPVTGQGDPPARHEREVDEIEGARLRDQDREVILRDLHLGAETVEVNGKPVSMKLEMHIRDQLAKAYGPRVFSQVLRHIRGAEDISPDEPISLRLLEARPEVVTRALAAAALDDGPGPDVEQLGVVPKEIPPAARTSDLQAEAKRKLEEARRAAS